MNKIILMLSIVLIAGCTKPSQTKTPEAPMGVATTETWADPLTEEFDVDGKKCRAWQVIRGTVINGKRWYGNSYIVDKFISCK
jgi:uncharacterized lipoprotein YajG